MEKYIGHFSEEIVQNQLIADNNYSVTSMSASDSLHLILLNDASRGDF